MTLAPFGGFRSVSWLKAGAALLALAAASGCAGDPFVGMDDQPLETGTGGSSEPPLVPRGGEAGSIGSGAASAGGSVGIAGNAGEGGSDEGGSSGSGVGGGSGAVGSGGRSGEGGGSAGAPTGGSAGGGSVTTTYALIDDLEGDFPRLPERDGRKGGWYAAHDASYGQASSAEAVAFQPVIDGNRYAVRMGGGGFTDWGAQLGVSLTSPDQAYDASGYCGVRFMAKGTGAPWSMLISDRQSVPQGGVCEQNGTCYRFVGKTFSVDQDWREVVIPFATMTTLADPNNGRQLDTSAVYDILFNFYSPTGAGFELFIDDLSFIKKTSAGCL